MKTGWTLCPKCREHDLLASEKDDKITCKDCDLEVSLDVSRKMGFTEALEAQRA